MKDEAQPDASGEGRQSRREFCTEACRVSSLALLGGALASVLEGCGGGGGSSPTAPNAQALPRLTATAGAGGLTLTVDASSPLAAVGSAALVQASNAYYLVAHTAADTYVAVSAICTHQTCVITGTGGDRYVCPCHGSQFGLTGNVLSGPANRSLRQYPVQLASGGVLTIGN